MTENKQDSVIVTAIVKALEPVKAGQTWLARQIGVNQPAISRYLKSGRIPAEKLEKICSVLGLTIVVKGAEDPWELRYALSRVRKLHSLTKDGLAEIMRRTDAIIASFEGGESGIAIPKVKRAKARKKEIA